MQIWLLALLVLVRSFALRKRKSTNNISVVYTQPPQKSNRGQKITKSPIQGISETLNIDYRNPQTLKDNQEEYNFLEKLDAGECPTDIYPNSTFIIHHSMPYFLYV